MPFRACLPYYHLECADHKSIKGLHHCLQFPVQVVRTSAQRAMLSKHSAKSSETTPSLPFFPLALDFCNSTARAMQGPFKTSYTAPQASSAASAASAGVGSPPVAVVVAYTSLSPPRRSFSLSPALATKKRTVKIELRSRKSGESLAVMDLKG